MQKPRPGAVVSFSGGLDSTTVLAEAVHRYGKENVIAVSFYYGQKHSLELQRAAEIAKVYGVAHQLVELPNIFKGAGSTLMDDDAELETMASYEDLAQKYGAQPTVVPNRNMHLIAVCATIALTKGLSHVMVGVHGTDSANYHYPDCTPMFIGAMSAALEIGNSGQVRLEAPYNTWSKGDIVRRAAELRVPLHLTQSCYSGVDPQCGECATCHERHNAFIEAGYQDPTRYARVMAGAPDLAIWPVPSQKSML